MLRGKNLFHSAHPFNKQQFVLSIQKINIGFIYYKYGIIENLSRRGQYTKQLCSVNRKVNEIMLNNKWVLIKKLFRSEPIL